ncbi:MAG TPA: ribosome recycling factor [Bacilli bacterium]|nr:ribosome recycling factor [Bacilli bacterium]
MPKQVIKQGEDRMLKTIEATKKEFSLVRTGKANPAILNVISIDYYGAPMPLNQIASISVPEPQMLMVKPYDKSILKQIEKAIQIADLGFNPINDGEVIRIPVPSLTEQIRKDLVKQVKKMAEENKVAIRNIRRDILDELKKMEKDALISEDVLKKSTEEVQKLTDKYIGQIDQLAKEKEQIIMAF